jgi:hypothetical protein
MVVVANRHLPLTTTVAVVHPKSAALGVANAAHLVAHINLSY